MYDIPLVTSSTVVTRNGFWNAIFLYHDKPHVVNRKLAGLSQAPIFKVSITSNSVKNLKNLFTHSGVVYEVRKLKVLSKEFLNEEFLKSFLEPYDKNVALQAVSGEDLKESFEGTFVSLRILLPRHKSLKKSVEIVVFDKAKNEAVFVAVADGNLSLAPNFPYSFEWVSSGHLRLCVDSIENADTSSAEWLSFALFQKVIKWAEELHLEPSKISSLSLISVDDYVNLYQNLKSKYGEKIVKIWPENTDPQKFVFEDIAIASYLICLWAKISSCEKPNFVDIGCGNGLLVYILIEEGFSGFGIDVRARKIWGLYPKHIQLEVSTIDPKSASFPGYNWIIGNHSDEMTLWIPVIALRSSPQTNFFLLPCCAYDFNGRKYKRLDSSRSQYSEYLDHAKNVSVKCGFEVKTDKLRIPSTKRTCLVGFERSYKKEDYESVRKNVDEYIQSILSVSENVVTRSPQERVRNCTQIDKGIIERIIRKCVDLLLEDKNYLVKPDGSKWNQGKTLHFSKLPKQISPNDLKELKRECGGLQTLLKNHRYLFVVENGTFRLREPPTFEKIGSKYRDKSCWFQMNHPDGCLHKADKCAYKHCDFIKQ